MTLRTKKVEKEIQDLIGQYLISHFPYRNEIIVSISNVAISNDLKQAKVYYSCYSPIQSEIDQKEVLKVLNEEKTGMQTFINQKIKMKFTPKLHFYYDETFEENFSLIQKLRDLGYAKAVDPSDDV